MAFKVILVVLPVCLAISIIILSIISSMKNTIKHSQIFIPKESPVCTFNIIRDYVRRHKKLPTGGKWRNISQGFPYSKFHSNVCKLPNTNLSDGHLGKCLLMKNVTKITILGDSNGLRMYEAVLEFIRPHFKKCDKVKKEKVPTGRLPDERYFVNDLPSSKRNSLNVNLRACGGCASQKTVCSNAKKMKNSQEKASIEYLTMEYTLDDEMYFNKPIYSSGLNTTNKLLSMNDCTTQEIYFKYYLRSTSPDLIILVQNSHDIMDMPINEAHLYIGKLLTVMKGYATNYRKIVWLNTPKENMLKKPKRYQNKNLFGYGGDYLSKLKTLNQRYLEILKSEFLKAESNIYPFLDMYQMADGIIKEWSIDGVHKQPDWYKHIISYLFYIICKSPDFTNIQLN